MAMLKKNKIGMYGEKTRALQKRLSYESVSLTAKTALIYRYLGSRTNDTPDITDIPHPIFREVADRAYDFDNPVEINVWYEMQPEQQMDLTRFGLLNPIGDSQIFKFHSWSFANDAVGRMLMVGDIIEIPFLLQDTTKAYFEVTDVNRKNENETFYIIVTADPMKDRQETEEILDMGSNDDFFKDMAVDMEDYQETEVDADEFDANDYEIDDSGVSIDYSPVPNRINDYLKG